MNSKIFYTILIVLILAGALVFYYEKESKDIDTPDYKNISYQIEGQTIKLVNGMSEINLAPNSASKQITKYFGNEASGDLNNDGKNDIVFLLTQNNGGSGTFYYVVAALSSSSGYHGTNAIFLGDRIAPQTTKIENGIIIINYADRGVNEAMTNTPSIGISKYLKITDGSLVTINQ